MARQPGRLRARRVRHRHRGQARRPEPPRQHDLSCPSASARELHGIARVTKRLVRPSSRDRRAGRRFLHLHSEEHCQRREFYTGRACNVQMFLQFMRIFTLACVWELIDGSVLPLSGLDEGRRNYNVSMPSYHTIPSTCALANDVPISWLAQTTSPT